MKVLLSAGGTGGHIFPAVSLGEELQINGHEVLLLSDKKINNYKSDRIGIKYRILPIRSYTGRQVNKLIFIITLCTSYIKSIISIIQFKPDVVIGFGGYPTIPPLLGALTLRKTILLHEQNSVMGLVNRKFLRFAKFALLSFKNTKYTTLYKDKCIYTGNPVTKKIAKLYSNTYKIDPKNKINILIIGGSQGSKILGELIPQTISKLPLELQERLSIVHQVNKNKISEITELYQSLSCEITINHFFTNIDENMKNAHIAISRAGASSMAELAIAGIPAIYIPLQNSTHNHQYINAKFASDSNSAIVIEEKNLNTKSLSEVLLKLISNTDELLKMSDAQKLISNPNSAKKIINKLSEI